MTKKLRLSERSDLTQVTNISELKAGIKLIYGVLPGREKTIILENKADPIEQKDYRRFWKRLISDGILYKEN